MTTSRPVSSHPRHLAVVLLGLATLLGVLLPGGAGATPSGPQAARPAATPKPTVASVTTALDRLARQAETLTEQFNGIRVPLVSQQHALSAARAAQASADASYERAHREFVALIEAQYEGDPMGSMGAILTSKDPAAYLTSLSTQALVARHSTDVLHRVGSARAAADQARGSADKLLAATLARRTALAHQRRVVDAQVVKFQQTLAMLTAAQVAAYSNHGAPTPAEIALALRIPAPTPAAHRAVQFAVAQVGKPYVWGAAGPDAFDCSGLTMAAWAKGGVSLAHHAATQYSQGKRIGYSQLQPGDLVFLYSDISHVEIYIGAGIAISAPQESEPVKYVHLADYRADFVGGTRPA